MADLVVLYKKPKDPAHFEKHYREVHVPLAKKFPGLKSCAFGPTTAPGGGEGAFFWMFTATFDSAEALHAALGSPEGKAAVADIPNYHTHPEAPTILVLDPTKG